MISVQVRPFKLREVSRMRQLNPEDIDQLVCIRGMVTRTSPPIPEIKQALFECSVCGYPAPVLIVRGKINEPSTCDQCHRPNAMLLNFNRSYFSDKQLVRLQEDIEETPAGETPFSTALFAYDDLVDMIRPGDRVEVTGIFRALPHRVNPKQRTTRSVYKTILDVIHFGPAPSKGYSIEQEEKRREQEEEQEEEEEEEENNVLRLREDEENLVGSRNLTSNHDWKQEQGSLQSLLSTPYFSEEETRLFHALSRRGDLYELLTNSLAPSIFEMNDVKKGLLCQLFGGVAVYKEEVGKDTNMQGEEEEEEEDRILQAHRRKTTEKAAVEGNVIKRGDINVLLCGDPGTSKSQLLSYIHKLTPRGIYTSGKGSSSVGLTASVVKDNETGDVVLESGALVLSDRGICCIDEFDKMSDTTRATLHEAMEQQTVSIAKAGIIATLNARTSILASANPLHSRYNPKLSIMENLRLPPTLISRFDLIYLVLDTADPENDRRLARHLISLYQAKAPETLTFNLQPPLTTGSPSASLGGNDVEGIDHDEDRQADLRLHRVIETNHQVIPRALLKRYIEYVRHTIRPTISEEAKQVLIDTYVDMRRSGGSKVITATARQLESLIRLTEALTKMRMRPSAGLWEVTEARRLMNVSTHKAATDSKTGKIDLSRMLYGGEVGSVWREKVVTEVRKTLMAEGAPSRLSIYQIVQDIQRRAQQDARQGMESDSRNTMISEAEVMAAVRELESLNEIRFLERSNLVIRPQA